MGDYVFGLKAQGRYNGEPLTGTGKIGGMLALRGEGTPFPVQADFRSGNTRVAFDGVVNDPMKMGGVDLRLKFSGDSLGDLYELTGVLLPDTPPFETDGRLVAKIDTEKSSVFDYRGFNGRIGDSDIHGSLVYTTGKPRPKLEGDVESRQLRLADLGPLIGVDSGKGAEKSKRSEQKKGEKSVQPAAKCCLMTASKPINGTLWMPMFASKGGALSMAVACRLAIFLLISSSKMLTCACNR